MRTSIWVRHIQYGRSTESDNPTSPVAETLMERRTRRLAFNNLAPPPGMLSLGLYDKLYH